MENEKKVKKIKKGLETCQKECDETCPYYRKSCMADLSKDSLTLINELEKEIKKNTSYAKGYADGIKNTYEVVMPDKLKEFVKRLKSKDCSVPIHTGIILIEDHVLEETLKEFKENESINSV